jgi:hypothetical protein
MKKISVLLVLFFFCRVSPSLAKSLCFYSYDESILRGDVCAEELDNNIEVIFTIHNTTKRVMDLKKGKYRAEKSNGDLYKLESPVIIYNEGGKNSYILNPGQVAQVKVKAPFRHWKDLQVIKRFYIKDLSGERRVFFVPLNKIEEYQKAGNVDKRHWRNLD